VFSAVVGVRAAGKAALAITNNQQGQSKIITPTKMPNMLLVFAAVGVPPHLAPTNRRCWCSCRWQSSVGNHQQPAGSKQNNYSHKNAQHVVGVA